MHRHKEGHINTRIQRKIEGKRGWRWGRSFAYIHKHTERGRGRVDDHRDEKDPGVAQYRRPGGR
jgi:hypothetical protein